MMEIFRARNTGIVNLMVDHLLPSDGSSKIDAAANIATMLNFYPDDVCIIVAFDDKELVGFVVGHLTGRPWFWSDFSWGTAGPKVMHEVQDMLENWGREQGCTEIRGATKRNPKACERAYGMKYLYSVLGKEL
jgi:hypothetical protein